MKTILTHAFKALESNPEHPSYSDDLKSKSDIQNETRKTDTESILNRIKINKKGHQGPKSITVRKGDDSNVHNFDIARIQKKPIQKDISKRLSRPGRTADGEELTADNHDNSDSVNQSNGHFTVSLKNLSPRVTDQDLKEFLSNNVFIIGSRVKIFLL